MITFLQGWSCSSYLPHAVCSQTRAPRHTPSNTSNVLRKLTPPPAPRSTNSTPACPSPTWRTLLSRHRPGRGLHVFPHVLFWEAGPHHTCPQASFLVEFKADQARLEPTAQCGGARAPRRNDRALLPSSLTLAQLRTGTHERFTEALASFVTILRLCHTFTIHQNEENAFLK